MGMIRLESDFRIVCQKNPRAQYYAWDLAYGPYKFIVDGFQHGTTSTTFPTRAHPHVGNAAILINEPRPGQYPNCEAVSGTPSLIVSSCLMWFFSFISRISKGVL